tara:strand:- start:53 stop:487 length:435 start_codon:yes stop_codon:yes gene_type:complete
MYKHTQVGYLILYVMLALVLLFGVIIVLTEFNVIMIAITVLILLILASFSWLTVTIDKKDLRIKFGYGIFSKRFSLKDIQSAKAVRNHWYYGWGIRIWFWPYMWIYNVSGFDAVEITMRNGKRYRIGSDDVERLVKVVNGETTS